MSAEIINKAEDQDYRSLWLAVHTALSVSQPQVFQELKELMLKYLCLMDFM
jgi:hypothetical protein